jgi:hypothetical protein
MKGTVLGLRGLAAASVVGFVAWGASAGAASLIVDDFNSVAAGANINGRTPTTDFNGAKWVASTSNFIGNGSGGLTANSGLTRSAFLDLGADYLAANRGVYQLSLDITQPSGSPNDSSWIGFGFAQGTSGGDSVDVSQQFVTNNGAPWLLWRLNGQEVVFGGPANTNQAPGTPLTLATGSKHTFTLQLDTAQTNWVVDAYVDGVQQDLNGIGVAGKSYSYASNPNGNPTATRYVGFATAANPTGALGTIDNFSLKTVPTPAASTAGAVTAAMSLLVGRRPRRR